MEYIIEGNGRKRPAQYVECSYCEEQFLKAIRFIKEGKNNFCCAEHSSLYRRNGDILKCAHCNKEFYRNKSKQENSKSGINFCSRKCKDIAQTYMKEIQPEHYGSGTGLSRYRKIAFETYGKVCNRCAHSDFDSLVVHHLDRNRDNNIASNLEVLCANCHMKEHKHRG